MYDLFHPAAEDEIKTPAFNIHDALHPSLITLNRLNFCFSQACDDFASLNSLF